MNISTFFDFLYPSLFAGLASLFSSAVSHLILPVQRTSLEAAVCNVLDAVRFRIQDQADLVSRAIGGGSTEASSAASARSGGSAAKTAPLGQPRGAIKTLCALYNEERHTINISCLPVTALKPVVDLVQDRIGRNPICRPALYGMAAQDALGEASGGGGGGGSGISPRSPLASPAIASALLASVAQLTGSVIGGIAFAEAGLADAYGWDGRRKARADESGNVERANDGTPIAPVPSNSSRSSRFTLRGVHEHRAALELAIARFEDDMQPWLDAELMDTVNRADGPQPGPKRDAQRLFRRRLDSQLAFAMVALLDVGFGVSTARCTGVRRR